MKKRTLYFLKTQLLFCCSNIQLFSQNLLGATQAYLQHHKTPSYISSHLSIILNLLITDYVYAGRDTLFNRMLMLHLNSIYRLFRDYSL